jgi:alkyl hydroperoxide reductase subunit AhpC
MLELGKAAPDFKLNAWVENQFKEIKLADYKGKWLVLFFYPLDFTFVCPTELKGFAKMQQKFNDLGVEIVAASTDSVHSHKAWFSKDLSEVKYPVLADTNHNLARDYQVLNEEEGTAQRGTFIIDNEGNVRYIVVSDGNVGRSVDETLRVVEALQSGGLCPMDWEAGQPNL